MTDGRRGELQDACGSALEPADWNVEPPRGPGTVAARKFFAVAVACVFLLTACDGMTYRQERRLANFLVTADDFNAIAETTFALIDPKNDIKTIAISATLDPRAVAALKRVRPVVPLVQAPTAAAEILPAGYFVVRMFSIEAVDAEPEARIEGQLGPVTKTMTAANMPDCGKIYTVVFVLKGGEWFNPSYKIETCAESRHWVPLDGGRL